MKFKIYKLLAQDITGVGSQGASTPTLFEKYFAEVKTAKVFAETDFQDSPRYSKIKWSKTSGGYSSGDLGDRMYTIETIAVG